MHRAASILGIGTNQIKDVPVDERLTNFLLF